MAEPQPLAALLPEIPTERNRWRVYRLTSLAKDEDLFEELGLDARSQQELRDLLKTTDRLESLEEALDAPFRRKPRLGMATRFSDGSYPVFYSSLDSETAEAEVAHWFRKSFGGRPRTGRTAYYQRFACYFEGYEKDLRDKRSEWPQLVHDDYAFCNRIGAEAIELGLDGLIAPSARREAGSNVPVFRRRAVNNPEALGIVTVEFHPE